MTPVHGRDCLCPLWRGVLGHTRAEKIDTAKLKNEVGPRTEESSVDHVGPDDS